MEKQSEEKSLEVVKQVVAVDYIIGDGMDLSHLSEDERFDLFLRKSEAQAGIQIDDSLLGVELIATAITPYQREFIDQETGEVKTATYVAFTLDNGEVFKTSSNKAIPFAMDIVRYVGVDPKTGALKKPLHFMIKPKKATTGFEYNYVAMRSNGKK